MKDVEKTIGNPIGRRKIVFTGPIDIEGFSSTRAMLQPRKCEGIQTLYFATNISSMRTIQYLKNHHVCACFCDSRFFRGVMLKGKMEMLTDNSTKEMIWREGDTLYYPLDVTNPDCCVLKFTAITGGCYGNFNSEDLEVE